MAAVRAPAKVNLRLVVLAREDSGYHQIETLFCALEFADELEIEIGSPGVHLVVRGADTGPADRNLACLAATAYFRALDREPAVSIVLNKRIPVGAGLGGGSSDAAAVLLALDRLHGNALGVDALARIGGRLGSDVPFFLCGSPLAIAWGRGNRLLRLPALPARDALIAVPPFPISTIDAYAKLARHRAATHAVADAAVLDLATLTAWDALASLVTNDFEHALFPEHPELRQAVCLLQEAGASPALLAGSGSALFGIFSDAASCDRASTLIAKRLPRFAIIRTRTATA